LREWAEATWDEIELGAATLTLPRERQKVNAAHIIPLGPLALSIVEGLPRFSSGDFLFSTLHGKRPISGFSKYKRRLDQLIASKAEVSPFVIHDLRRTCRTRLSGLGVAREVAEKVIGHQDQGIVKVYDRYEYFHEKRDALLRWEKRLLSIVEPPPDNVVPMPAKARA